MKKKVSIVITIILLSILSIHATDSGSLIKTSGFDGTIIINLPPVK